MSLTQAHFEKVRLVRRQDYLRNLLENMSKEELGGAHHVVRASKRNSRIVSASTVDGLDTASAPTP